MTDAECEAFLRALAKKNGWPADRCFWFRPQGGQAGEAEPLQPVGQFGRWKTTPGLLPGLETEPRRR